jgi:SAM-dependent methyltransferase
MSALPPNVTILDRLDDDHDGYRVTDAELMRELSTAEDSHYWHMARNRLIERGICRTGARPGDLVIDLGCGGGVVAAHLSRAGFSVVGVDGHLVRIAEAAARAPSASFYVHDLGLGVDGVPAGASLALTSSSSVTSAAIAPMSPRLTAACRVHENAPNFRISRLSDRALPAGLGNVSTD